MAMSTIYVWITTCCNLFFSYFLACKLTKERVRKYARKGMEKESEFEIKRFQTFLFPPFGFPGGLCESHVSLWRNLFDL